MTRGVGGESPANVQKYLKGVDYPAKKNDLVKKAENNQAPDDILEMIRSFPNQEYNGPQDVMKAYGQLT